MQAIDAFPPMRGWKPDDPRRKRVAAKRQAIIDAARPIFLSEGWTGASLERVATESGISKMTVYRHFGSKQELFEALVDGMCAHMVQQAGDAPLPPAQHTTKDRLRAEAHGFTTALTQPDAIALYRLIVADGWRFPTLARVFERSGVSVLRQRVAAILAGAVPEHEIASRASGFVSLALGDAYLEATIGLPVEDIPARFARQIGVAVGFVLSPM